MPVAIDAEAGGFELVVAVELVAEELALRVVPVLGVAGDDVLDAEDVVLRVVPVLELLAVLDVAGAVEVAAEDVFFVELVPELDAAGLVAVVCVVEFVLFAVLVLELAFLAVLDAAGFVAALVVEGLVLFVVPELDAAGAVELAEEDVFFVELVLELDVADLLVVVVCVVELVLLPVVELFPADDVFGTATVFSFGGLGTSSVYGVSGSLWTSFTVGVT